MRAPNRPFEHRPKGFQGVHVNIPTRPFFLAVIDHSVVITEPGKNAVRHPFIGTNPRPLGDIIDDLRDQGTATSRRNDFGIKFTVPLKDAEHDGLPGSSTTPFAGPFAANVGFIDLDVTRKRRIAINQPHVLPNLVGYPKGRRIGNAQLALNLFRRDTMARGGEQVHRIEPLLERHVRAMKGRSDHWVNVMTAPLALVGRFLADAMVLPALATLRTIKRVAVAKLHQVVQAGIVVREALEKI